MSRLRQLTKFATSRVAEPDDRQTGMSERNLAGSVAPFDVLSLDVFDTITCRTWFTPRDIFAVLARELEPNGDSQRWEFIATARHNAEKSLRISRNGVEPSLHEIHRKLTELTGRDERSVDGAVATELAIECRSARAIRGMVERREIARTHGKRVVYLSDTYFSETQVRELLGDAIADSDPVFTSRDQAASKRKGDLFHLVADGDTPARYFHIGDKKTSDFVAPRDAGWASAHFRTSSPSRLERHLALRPWRAALAGSAVAGAAKSARLATAGMNMRSAQLAAIGADVGGPLYTAFTAWCFSSAKELDCEMVIFLARDGQICARIAQVQQPAIAFNYLYASRQALYFPAIFAVGDEAWCWLERGLTNSTAAEALERFGIDAHTVADLLMGAGIAPHDRLGSKILPKLVAILRGPLAKTILARAVASRLLVCDYFRPVLAGRSRVAFVDVGWKGRLQRCLERILQTDVTMRRLEICGLYLSLSQESILHARNTTRCMYSYSQIDSPIIVETLALADHGTTIGYERTIDGHVGPVLAATASDLEADVSDLQGAAIRFASDLYHNIDIASLDRAGVLLELNAAALEVLKLLTNEPSPQEAACLGGFVHSDDPNHVGATMLAPVLSHRQIISAVIFGVNQQPKRLSYWLAGSLVRSLPRARTLAAALLQLSAARVRVRDWSKRGLKRGSRAACALLC